MRFLNMDVQTYGDRSEIFATGLETDTLHNSEGEKCHIRRSGHEKSPIAGGCRAVCVGCQSAKALVTMAASFCIGIVKYFRKSLPVR